MPISVTTPTTIEFGNGSSTTTSLAAQLNNTLKALVIPDSNLIEDLVSTNPIIDMGYDILLSKGGGWILDDTTKVIPILRDNQKWTVDLEKLKPLQANNKSATQCLLTKTNEINKAVYNLHRRMGHPSSKQMTDAIKSGTWITDVTPEQVQHVMNRKPCNACIMGKRNHTPVPRVHKDPTTIAIADVISGDIVGPIFPPTRTGHRYFFLFVDRRTSFLHVFTSPTKDGFITSLKRVYEDYKTKGHTIKAFRSDSENIMIEGKVEEFLNDTNITPNHSLPYEHYQNLVERHVQTVVKLVATIIHDQQLLNASFWDYALFYAVQTWNQTPNTKTVGNTPYRLINNTTQPIDIQREFTLPFDTPVAIRNPKPSWRFDTKRDLGVFLGPISGSIGGGLIYIPSTNNIVARGDLIEINIENKEFDRYTNARLDVTSPQHVLTDSLIINDSQTKLTSEEDPSFSNAIPGEVNIEKHPTTLNKTLSRRQTKRIISRMTTRSLSKLTKRAMKATVRTNDLSSALAGEEKEQWLDAIRNEIDSLFNVTNTLVPETPDVSSDYDVIYGTIVLKKKMNNKHEVEKFKARLCGCGNQLVKKNDYFNETYSPTVNALVHSLLLQMMVVDRMYAATYDTIAAYLHQEYPSHYKPLYIKLPRALAIALDRDPDQLYRVKKYIYGLPDAGRAYYLALSEHLVENGYIKSSFDPCLFYKINGECRTYLWSHVDDLFCVSTNNEELQILNEILSSKFPIKMNTDVTTHLGIQIDKTKDGGIKMTQPKLLHELFQEFINHPLKTSTTKYPSTPRKRKRSTLLCDKYQYLRLMGKLLFLTTSRPDIMTSVSFGATRNVSPTVDDYDDLLQIVQYLYNTKDIGLTLYPSHQETSSVKLIAYVDASYLTHEDASSHTGFTIGISSCGDEPQSFFHTKSRKQKLIATSSTHAEMRALYELTTSIIFITCLMNEINRPIDLPVVIFEDNQPVVDLVTQPVSPANSRSKHFTMLTRFVNEQVEKGLIELRKVASERNIANVLTKIVCGKEFIDSFNKIMGTADSG